LLRTEVVLGTLRAAAGQAEYGARYNSGRSKGSESEGCLLISRPP